MATATSTGCEYHEMAGECTEECVTLANQMNDYSDYSEPREYGDYLGGVSSVDRSGCHYTPPSMVQVAVLDPVRRAVVWTEVCPYEEYHDAMPCEVCPYLGE